MTKLDPKIVEQLLIGYKKPEDIIGENGLLKQLTKAVLERALQAEMTGHLGYEKHDPAGNNSGNSRNGVTRKTLKGDGGKVSDTMDGIRREYPLYILPGHVDAGDSGSPGRDVPGGSESGFYFYGDERGRREERSGRTGRWRRCIRSFIRCATGSLGYGQRRV
jgi:Transposase, Mutator family